MPHVTLRFPKPQAARSNRAGVTKRSQRSHQRAALKRALVKAVVAHAEALVTRDERVIFATGAEKWLAEKRLRRLVMADARRAA